MCVRQMSSEDALSEEVLEDEDVLPPPSKTLCVCVCVCVCVCARACVDCSLLQIADLEQHHIGHAL